MMFSQKLHTQRIYKRLAKALIRLRVCAGLSEPLLVALTTLLEISCNGSIIFQLLKMYYSVVDLADLDDLEMYHTKGAQCKYLQNVVLFSNNWINKIQRTQ